MTNTKTVLPTEHCETCPAFTQLEQMGIKVGDFDRVIALAGNPNTGKSTLFNCADWAETTHRQLAWQNRDPRRRRI